VGRAKGRRGVWARPSPRNGFGLSVHSTHAPRLAELSKADAVVQTGT